MNTQLIISSNANLQKEATSVQRGDAYVKRYLEPSDYEWDEQIQVILKDRSLDFAQKSTAIEDRIKELFNSVPDSDIQVKDSQWSDPEIDQQDISKLIDEYQSDLEFEEREKLEYPTASKQSKLVIGAEDVSMDYITAKTIAGMYRNKPITMYHLRLLVDELSPDLGEEFLRAVITQLEKLNVSVIER